MDDEFSLLNPGNMQRVLGGNDSSMMLISSIYKLEKHYRDKGLDLVERYKELLEQEDESALTAFTRLAEEMRIYDDKYQFEMWALEKVLKLSGCDAIFMATLYKINQHWLAHGIDVMKEYKSDIYDEEEIERVSKLLMLACLPKGRFTVRLSNYLTYVLKALGRIKCDKHFVPMGSLFRRQIREAFFRATQEDQLIIKGIEDLEAVAGEDAVKRSLELLAPGYLKGEEQAELDHILSGIRKKVKKDQIMFSQYKGSPYAVFLYLKNGDKTLSELMKSTAKAESIVQKDLDVLYKGGIIKEQRSFGSVMKYFPCPDQS